MATFAVGQSITTREPRIVVDAGLKPGVHRFALVVVASDGRKSKADAAAVTVTEGRTVPVTPVFPVTPVTPVPDVTPR